MTSFYVPPSLVVKLTTRSLLAERKRQCFPEFYIHVTVWGVPVVHVIAMAEIKCNFIGFQLRKGGDILWIAALKHDG